LNKYANQAITLGIQFAVAVGLCLAGGYWLDQKLSTTPLFIIIGVFLGGSAGFLSIYREVYSEKKDKNKNLPK